MRRFMLFALVASGVALAGDAPEISRSVGKPGGVVVMWPRIVPRTDDPAIVALAGAMQSRLAEVAAAATPNVDTRPRPERVCPQAGCKAATVGAVLAHSEGGCVAVAWVAPGGASPQSLVPWAGDLTLKQDQVPFREPPESQISVHDFVPCGDLQASLGAREGAIREVLKAAVSAPRK